MTCSSLSGKKSPCWRHVQLRNYGSETSPSALIQVCNSGNQSSTSHPTIVVCVVRVITVLHPLDARNLFLLKRKVFIKCDLKGHLILLLVQRRRDNNKSNKDGQTFLTVFHTTYEKIHSKATQVFYTCIDLIFTNSHLFSQVFAANRRELYLRDPFSPWAFINQANAV